ncbi:unnamed protein product [Scytosiphon promiscuus]
MGHHHSSFNKANFRRGIRGYRQMFASLHLEENELKKLWVEFGRIDTDNGGTVSIRELLSHCDLDCTPFAYRLFGIFDQDNSGAVDFREFVLSTWNCCTMDQDSLIRFAFDLFDRDRSGAIEATEVEAMLREIYGDAFAESPTAALTLQRVRELASQSDDARAKKPSNLKASTLATEAYGEGRIQALSFEAFREFCRQHSGMLFPAFTLQKTVRSKIVSEAFWKGCADRRNGARSSKKGGRLMRKHIHLQELSTMIRLNEGSMTGTTSDKGMAACGSTLGSTEPRPGRSTVRPRATCPATSSPSPAPGEGLGGSTIDGRSRSEGLTSAQGQQKVDDCHFGACDGKKRRSAPQEEGEGGHGKDYAECGKGGTPRKRASTSIGVVAVEADGSSQTCSGTPSAKTPRVSAQVRIPGVWTGGLSFVYLRPLARWQAQRLAVMSHDSASDHVQTEDSTMNEGNTKRNTRQTYPLPVDEGGRGISAWARGGENNLSAPSGSPHFQRKSGENNPNRRRNQESRVDSPLTAATRAAAAYGLPALRESPGNKRHSRQACDLVAGNAARGGRIERSSGRPRTAGGDNSPDARQRRRETGQAAADARAAAKSGGSNFGYGVSATQTRNTLKVHPGEHHPKKRGTH